jgi:hypothetical protein
MSPPGERAAGTGHRVFGRPESVVWRLAPDRVLVRRIGDLGNDGCADLIGLAAAVWVGLDEPASLAMLQARLTQAGITPTEVECADTVRVLVERHWIDVVTDQPAADRPNEDHER